MATRAKKLTSPTPPEDSSVTEETPEVVEMTDVTDQPKQRKPRGAPKSTLAPAAHAYEKANRDVERVQAQLTKHAVRGEQLVERLAEVERIRDEAHAVLTTALGQNQVG